MSKAILILDKMPNECMECPLRFKDGDTDDWFRFICHMSTDQVNKGERLENCPLKPLPLKKTDFEDMMFSWNDCIDEILRGNE